MLNLMSHLKIHHLHQAGMTQGAIAQALDCSVRTVHNVLKARAPTPAEITQGAMERNTPMGRPSQIAGWSTVITTWLSENADLKVAEILRRLRSDGYQGSPRPVYQLVKRLRPPPRPASPEVRFEGLPGEFAQFDFGQCVIHCRDGTAHRVRFFEGVLKYSRHRHVVLVPDESAETLARATVACFSAWGGAPKQWVYDNPATVWYDRTTRTAHPYLRQLLADANALVEATVPRRPNQKGLAENTVGYVKHGFLLGRSFLNGEAPAAELPEWLRWINEERPNAATGIIPAVRLAEERDRLSQRTVPYTATSFPLLETATVLPTGLVRWKGAAYSVDPTKIGAPATIRVCQHTIEIDINGHRCTHERHDHSHGIYRLPEHSLAQIAVTTEERKKTYAKRQHLFDMGGAVVSFCDHIIMSAVGNAWYRDIHRLYDLAMKAGPSRFLEAVSSCLERHDYRVSAVSGCLAQVETAI